MLVEHGVASLRVLSQEFSQSAIRCVGNTPSRRRLSRRIRKHLPEYQPTTLGQFYDDLYRFLRETYRIEYVFKNEIISSLFFQELMTSKSVLMNEVRVGDSIADVVVLNGDLKVLEIKTDYDDFSKLSKQVFDYYKIASKVCLVTSEEQFKRLDTASLHPGCGIIVLNENGDFTTRKKARSNYGDLEHERLFKLLRKKEYLSIVQDVLGGSVKVKPVKLFEHCLDQCRQVPLREFQNLVIACLKQRQESSRLSLECEAIPNSLNYLHYFSGLRVNETDQLVKSLNRKI